MKAIQQFSQTVRDNVERVILGKRDVIDLLILALLADGHVLLEDKPGTGKTMLARALAASLGLDFKRLQCTPDLLPADVTGVLVFDQQSGQFAFRPGPVFANIVLADEINRATPRTQSALLEAMGEGQVTADGITHRLTPPFFVFATQNPIEYEGTFPLPEAQLDRFLLKVGVGYPEASAEDQMLQNLRGEHPIDSLGQVLDGHALPDLQRQVWTANVDHTVRQYILALVDATRRHPDLALGASPRGSLALYKTGQAWAAMHGRDFVLPDDVKRLAAPSLAHRLIVRPEAELRGRSAATVLGEILDDTEVPLGTPSD